LTSKNIKKAQRQKMTKIAILVIFPFILLLLPKTLFDHSHYTLCIVQFMSGKDCVSCGLTRACMHLIHLDFKAAAYFNKISFIVLPILCGLLIAELYQTIKAYRALRKASSQSSKTIS
jgi:hypothetical protein